MPPPPGVSDDFDPVAAARAILADPSGVDPATVRQLRELYGEAEPAPTPQQTAAQRAYLQTHPRGDYGSFGQLEGKIAKRREAAARPSASQPVEVPAKSGAAIVPSVYIDDESKSPLQRDEEYARQFDEQTAAGNTVYRLRDMDGVGSDLMKGTYGALGLLRAADKGGTGGMATTGLMTGAELLGLAPKGSSNTMDQAERKLPLLLSVPASMIGAAAPGSLARGIAGLVKAEAPAATALGRVGMGALEGIEASALEGGIEEATEAAGRGLRGEQQLSPQELGTRLGIRAGAGLLAGGLAQGAGELGEAAYKGLREGPAKHDLGIQEANGGGTTMNIFQGGLKKPPAVHRAIDAASASGDAMHPEDVFPKRASQMLADEVNKGSGAIDEAVPLVSRNLPDGTDITATGHAMEAIGKNATRVRKKVHDENEASLDAMDTQRVSTDSAVDRMLDIAERDMAQGARLPFSSTGKFGTEATKLMRPEVVDATNPVLDQVNPRRILTLDQARKLGIEGLPEESAVPTTGARELNFDEAGNASPEQYVVLRGIDASPRELESFIKILDDKANEGAASTDPLARDFRKVSREARKLRDEFELNGEKGGYSKQRAGHESELNELGNRFTALGLPRNTDSVDPRSLQQAESVNQSLRQYGSDGNEMRDRVLREFSSENPELGQSMAKMTTVRDRSRMLGLKGTGSEKEAGIGQAVRGYGKGGLADSTLEAIGAEDPGLAQALAGVKRFRGNQTALGLPHTDRVDMSNPDQAQALFRAASNYMDQGHTISDDVLNIISKDNPELAQMLRDGAVVRSYTRMRGKSLNEGPSFSGITGAYVPAGKLRLAVDPLTNIMRGARGKGADFAARGVNPLFGPMDQIFRGREEKKTP